MATPHGQTEERTAGRARHGRPDDAPTEGPRHQSPAGGPSAPGGRHGGGPGQTPYQERFGTLTVSPPAGVPAPPGDVPAPPVVGTRTTGELPAPPGRSRRWPWLLAGALSVLLVGFGMGRASVPPAPVVAAPPPVAASTPAPSSPAPPPPAPARVTIPNVTGQNGAIVVDQLQKLGLTKVQFASRDDADTVVVNPANWTVTKIEPRAGTKAATDATVVVTMTKQK